MSAPIQDLPSWKFNVIEYPANVQNVDKAISNLSGIKNIERSFTTLSDIDCKLRDDLFAHSITGNISETTNLVLRVTTTKTNGIVTATRYQVTGVAAKVARFRSIADYQFSPSNRDLPNSIDPCRTWNVEEIEKIKLPNDSDYSILGNFPPPLFSRVEWPLDYNYKQSGSTKTENSLFQKSKAVQTFTFDSKNSTVPQEPLSLNTNLLLEPLIIAISRMFNERPIWTRSAIVNSSSFTELEVKSVLPFIAYSSPMGAFRDCWIKFKFDPRLHPDSFIYQVVECRNARGSGRTKPDKTASNAVAPPITGIIQIVDFTDQKLISCYNSIGFTSSEFDEKLGWINSESMKKFKVLVREFLDSRKDEGGLDAEESMDELENIAHDYRVDDVMEELF